MTIDVSQFSKSTSEGSVCLAAEASDLREERFMDRPPIWVSNFPKGGEDTLFRFTHSDLDEGDVVGWNYKSSNGDRLLIIND